MVPHHWPAIGVGGQTMTAVLGALAWQLPMLLTVCVCFLCPSLVLLQIGSLPPLWAHPFRQHSLSSSSATLLNDSALRQFHPSLAPFVCHGDSFKGANFQLTATRALARVAYYRCFLPPFLLCPEFMLVTLWLTLPLPSNTAS